MVHTQQEELNNRQHLLLSHDDLQREMDQKIKSLLSEIKSSKFLEKQNLELFEKVQLLNSELSQSNASNKNLSGEIKQIREFKELHVADSLKAEATFTVNISYMDFELKEANLSLKKCEAEKIDIQRRLAKKEQSFLLREELLLDQIGRLKQSKYESLSTVNELTDKYHTAEDSLETKDHLITVSNLRNAVLEDRRSSPTPSRSAGYQPYSF